MLEGRDARIHYVYYTPEIEGARNRGGLRTNSFIQLRKSTADSRLMLEIDDMGDSEALLHDKRQLRQVGQRLIRRGIMPEDDGLERMARSVSKGASGRRDHPRNSKRNAAIGAQQESGSWPLMRRSIFRASPDRSDWVNRR